MFCYLNIIAQNMFIDLPVLITRVYGYTVLRTSPQLAHCFQYDLYNLRQA